MCLPEGVAYRRSDWFAHHVGLRYVGAMAGSASRTSHMSVVERSPTATNTFRRPLFLIYQEELGSLALRLRIPPVEFARTATGSLQIQSVLGQRTYQVADLHTARLVRLAPQFPLAICTGFGDLLPLAAHLSGQVSAFAADRNLFYAEEKGGRYAFSDEPLECGTRYRLL